MPRLRRAALPLALGSAIAFAFAASAAPAAAVIVPQDNIAGVKIDMSQEKVLDVLGDPAKTVTRLGGGSGEVPITTYSYLRRGIRVHFIPNDAGTENIAFYIEVYADRGQRTAEGIRIGSTRAAVRRKVAGVRCKRYDPSYAICIVGSGKVHRVSTVFLLDRRNKVKRISLDKPFDE
jgi:hypothetical protein